RARCSPAGIPWPLIGGPPRALSTIEGVQRRLRQLATEDTPCGPPCSVMPYNAPGPLGRARLIPQAQTADEAVLGRPQPSGIAQPLSPLGIPATEYHIVGLKRMSERSHHIGDVLAPFLLAVSF